MPFARAFRFSITVCALAGCLVASACIAAITPAPAIPNPCRRVLPPGPEEPLLILHPGGEQLQVLGQRQRRRLQGTRRGLVRHALTLRFFRGTASPPRPATLAAWTRPSYSAMMHTSVEFQILVRSVRSRCHCERRR